MDKFAEAGAQLLACLCAALQANPNPPGICCVRVGDVVTQDMGILLDECCEGQAYVRLAGMYPSSEAFPGPDTGAISACSIHSWAVAFELGVFRCLPTGDANVPATCEEWTATAAQAMLDSQALRNAACCISKAVTESYGGESVSVGQIVPAGPNGGCVGQTLVITIQVDGDCGC